MHFMRVRLRNCYTRTSRENNAANTHSQGSDRTRFTRKLLFRQRQSDYRKIAIYTKLVRRGNVIGKRIEHHIVALVTVRFWTDFILPRRTTCKVQTLYCLTRPSYSPSHKSSAPYAQSQRDERSHRNKCTQHQLANARFCDWTSPAHVRRQQGKYVQQCRRILANNV